MPAHNKQVQRARTNHKFVLGYVRRRVAFAALCVTNACLRSALGIAGARKEGIR